MSFEKEYIPFVSTRINKLAVGDNDIFLLDISQIKNDNGLSQDIPLVVSVYISWRNLNAVNGYVKLLQTDFSDYSDTTKSRWSEIPTLNCLTNTTSRTIKRTHGIFTSRYLGLRINPGTATQYNYDVKIKILNKI